MGTVQISGGCSQRTSLKRKEWKLKWSSMVEFSNSFVTITTSFKVVEPPHAPSYSSPLSLQREKREEPYNN